MIHIAQKKIWGLTLVYLIVMTNLNAENGVCFIWSEGDALHLDSCAATTLDACSRGRKKIQNKDTAFQIYKGKLFKDNDNNIYEFRNESIDSCEKELVKSAREAELTMCSNWGKSVYSSGLKVGDKAYIYGKSVNVRESPSIKSKKVSSPADRTEVKILEKSEKEDSLENLYSSYWFKISIGNVTGWVYGQFLHPNPNSKQEFVQ